MTNLPRFSLSIPEDLLEEVDGFQESRNISTRSKAIQRLLVKGLNDYIMESMGCSEAQAELLTATNGLCEEDIQFLTRMAKRLSGAEDTT